MAVTSTMEMRCAYMTTWRVEVDHVSHGGMDRAWRFEGHAREHDASSRACEADSMFAVHASRPSADRIFGTLQLAACCRSLGRTSTTGPKESSMLRV